MRLINSLLFIAAAGCSAESNLFRLTTPDEQRDNYANLVVTAQAAYDRGDLARALKLSKRAHALDPDAEEAAILYGFVNLSLAHGDPYGLAQGLMEYQKEKADADPAAEQVSPLTALKSVIGLTDAEIVSLGTMDLVDPALPVIVPGCAEAVRASAERLAFLNDALVSVCPYVPISARVLHDIRQRCLPSERASQDTFRALFLWSFAHLSEALAFNGVLTYATVDTTGKKSNLELRVEGVKAVDTTNPANLPAFLTAIDGIRTTLEAVMPVSGECSPNAPTTQLSAMLDDMLAVDNSFALMAGIPKKITQSIREAVARIRQLQSSAPSPKALKADFNKKISSQLATKLDEIQAQNPGQLTTDQKTQACGAYTSISGGLGDVPALCEGLSLLSE